MDDVWARRSARILRRDEAACNEAGVATNASAPPPAKRPRAAEHATMEAAAPPATATAALPPPTDFARVRALLHSSLGFSDGSAPFGGGSASPSPWARVHARARLASAHALFDEMCGPLALPPNARSYALLLATALSAGDGAAAGALLARMLASGVASLDSLVTVLQPRFLLRLSEAGALRAVGVADGAAFEALFAAPPLSHKWCFLAAAHQAALGDQTGSKHGGVLVGGGGGGDGGGGDADADGRALSAKQLTGGNVVPLAALTAAAPSAQQLLAIGRNHRFGIPKNAHLRVMHSEVHCLVQLRTGSGGGAPHAPELARNAAAYVVELDRDGIGYEEGVPCASCGMALCQLGVASVFFSAHDGLRSLRLGYRPALRCHAYADALRRVYPVPATVNPDGQHAADYRALCESGGSFWPLFEPAARAALAAAEAAGDDEGIGEGGGEGGGGGGGGGETE